MSYKIILDSCGEIPEKYQGDNRLERVPLSLEVGDYMIYDDESFDQAEFLAKVAACPTCIQSGGGSCICGHTDLQTERES